MGEEGERKEEKMDRQVMKRINFEFYCELREGREVYNVLLLGSPRLVEAFRHQRAEENKG